MTTVEEEIEDLISSYHELNAASIEELEEEPSALEFMRHVACNRPFVIRGGANSWHALSRWNGQYLSDVMAGQMVNVAITPHGNADSVLSSVDGSTLFVKPYEREIQFQEALDYIAEQGIHTKSDPYVHAESQVTSDLGILITHTENDNLRDEYESLFKDVPKSVPFARIALQQDPDAINFWLGNSRSTTALHKDPYENIYVQVLGQKHFVLLPPVESACINERLHRAATCEPSDAGLGSKVDLGQLELKVVVDDPVEMVPFATWDPDLPQKNITAFSKLSRPMKVTLNPGDMLYLPALWYHKVSQSCSEEGICCAVNYWYDLQYSGSFFALSTFARRVGLMATRSDAISQQQSVKENGAGEEEE